MARANISWKSELPDGEKIEVYAEKIGDRWLFHRRSGRYEDWRPHESPSLEDYLTLLDGLQRRIQRRWYRPEEEPLLVKKIHTVFPDADLSELGVPLETGDSPDEGLAYDAHPEPSDERPGGSRRGASQRKSGNKPSRK